MRITRRGARLVTLAEKWAQQDADTWRRELMRRCSALGPNARVYEARARRVLAAAENQLAIAKSGAWPDDDRAPRFTVGEPTRPG